MATFRIERRHVVPGSATGIPELSPEISRKFITGELDGVGVEIAEDIEKLRLPRLASCFSLYTPATEVHLSDRLRAELVLGRCLKGPEGSTLDVCVYNANELSVQFLRLRAATAEHMREQKPYLHVYDQGFVGAILVQGHFETETAIITGPRSGPGKLKIGMMDRRHLTRDDGNVEVMQFLNDSEIAVKVGPLSSRHQSQGPKGPPGEPRNQGRGYKP